MNKVVLGSAMDRVDSWERFSYFRLQVIFKH